METLGTQGLTKKKKNRALHMLPVRPRRPKVHDKRRPRPGRWSQIQTPRPVDDAIRRPGGGASGPQYVGYANERSLCSAIPLPEPLRLSLRGRPRKAAMQADNGSEFIGSWNVRHGGFHGLNWTVGSRMRLETM